MAQEGKKEKVLHRFDAKEQAQEQAKKSEKRLSDIVEGKEPPPNKFVAYLLEKLKAARQEFDELQQSLARARQIVSQMETRALVLQGEHNKYLEDIKAWDKEVVGGSDVKEPGEEVVSTTS